MGDPTFETMLKKYIFVPDSQLKTVPDGTKVQLREEGKRNVLYPFFEKILAGIVIEQTDIDYAKRCSITNLKIAPYYSVVLNFFNSENDSILNTIVKNRSINQRIADEVQYHSLVRFANERDLYQKVVSKGFKETPVAAVSLEERLLIFKSENEIVVDDFAATVGYNKSLLLPKHFQDLDLDFNQYYNKLQNIIGNLDARITPINLKWFHETTVTYKLTDLVEKIQNTKIFEVDKRARCAIDKLRNGSIRDINGSVGYSEMMGFFDDLDRHDFYSLPDAEQVTVLTSLLPLLLNGYKNSTIPHDVRTAFSRDLIDRSRLHLEVLARSGSK